MKSPVEKIEIMKTIRILIADDHQIIHSGIGDILKSHNNLEIVGNAYNGEEAVEKALSLKPDVIFMDISMPKMGGIEATGKINSELPNIKIIALTQHDENEYVIQILKAGGKGYMHKNSKKEDFMDAINRVMNNERYLSYELSFSMVDEILDKSNENKPNPGTVHLTRREIEIIKKIAEEKNNQEIADEFRISLRTVETHRRNIMQKLNAKSVVSIIKYASQHNLIDL